MLRAAAIVLLFALLPLYVWAEARIAMLIGNQLYSPKAGPLKNPHDNVALIGAALKNGCPIRKTLRLHEQASLCADLAALRGDTVHALRQRISLVAR